MAAESITTDVLTGLSAASASAEKATGTMTAESDYFERRSRSYDSEAVHQRIVSLMVGGLELQPGFTVLDIATGTGMAALKAAQRVGPGGKVIGIDPSKGMLAKAQHNAAAVGLENVQFVHGNAAHLPFQVESFDCIMCASALVLMPDIPRALRHWATFLKVGGTVCFDAPAGPFGLSQRAVKVAAHHGIRLAYGDAADTPEKCRTLLENAGYEVLVVHTELANTASTTAQDAIAFWDQRIEHPAWKPIKESTASERLSMRDDFVRSIEADTVDGYVSNDIALNFAYGRRLL